MQLRLLHRILINAAIALAALFGARALVMFSRDHALQNLALALLSAAIGVALALYLRRTQARWSKDSPNR